MAGLYPTFDAPTLYRQTQTTQALPKYGRAPRFDFVTGDFMLDGANRVPILDGHRAWVQWCAKAIRCERFSALVYGPQYGVELERAGRRRGREAVESEVQRTITEALMVDRRTKAVTGFSFTWNGDALTVAFTVVPRVGTAERLEVSALG